MSTKIKTLVILAVKSSKLIKAVKVLKALKSAKVMLSAGTMFLSVVMYSFSLGWKFAFGLVGMLFIHELGHVIACKKKGVPASAPIFIPFLGAAIFAPKMDKKEDEAYIGIGGPYLGSLGALLCFFLFLFLPEKYPTLLALSYLGAIINLFNLIPIRPLDGGRITQIVGSWFKWVGVAILLLLTLATKDPGLLIIWIIVIDDLRWKNKKMKFGFCVGIAVLMVASMLVLKINPIILLADLIIATLVLLTMAVSTFESLIDGTPTVQEDDTTRGEDVNVRTKVKWFCWYSVLTIALLFFLHLNQTLLSEFIPPR